MKTARVFENGRGQAVQMPEEIHFDTEEVGISKAGDLVLLFPREKAWQIMEAALGQFSDDFMADRDQGGP